MNVIYVIFIMMFFCSGMAMLTILALMWHDLNKEEKLWTLGFSVLCLAMSGYLIYLAIH